MACYDWACETVGFLNYMFFKKQNVYADGVLEAVFLSQLPIL